MASGNLGKLREIARLLADLDCDIVPQSDFALSEAIEDGDTFTANALIKARHAAKLTSLPAIADDSGLVVDALQGRPGVYSARYAGADASDEDNIDKLHALAEALLEYETIDGKEVKLICDGKKIKRPVIPPSDPEAGGPKAKQKRKPDDEPSGESEGGATPAAEPV